MDGWMDGYGMVNFVCRGRDYGRMGDFTRASSGISFLRESARFIYIPNKSTVRQGFVTAVLVSHCLRLSFLLTEYGLTTFTLGSHYHVQGAVYPGLPSII